MLVLPIIPLFLGIAIQEEYKKEIEAVFTFHVQIDTFYGNTSLYTYYEKNASLYSYHEENAGLSFDLICLPERRHGVKCYIRKNSTDYSPKAISERTFIPSSLVYEGIPFNIFFNATGAKSCVIPKKNVANKSTLLQMYRAIGDQLNIGADIKSMLGKKLFYETDHSFSGTCPTFYKFTRDRNFTKRDYSLHTIGDREIFKENRILRIRKYRNVYKCVKPQNYTLGKILWQDLPLRDLTVKMKNSESLMSIARHYFSSQTKNTFNLFNDKKDLIRFVKEIVVVNLTSVKL